MRIIKNIFKKLFRRRKQLTPEQREVIATNDFFDRMLPGTVKFYSDHYICGNYYKSVWAITEYPPNTEETALLSHLADRSGVSLRVYNRLVSALEQKKIMQQAARKNHMMSGTNDINESVKAEENMNDIVNLIAELKRDRETLLHYLFLSNMTAIEYIRNGMKRVRKKESAFILASQNIEDFLIPEVKEFTKPLFSIPTHSFYFNVGNCSAADFMDTVQLLKPEYDLIAHPERGTCLYRCGNERYLLQVHAPAYKEALFGKAGGR